MVIHSRQILLPDGVMLLQLSVLLKLISTTPEFNSLVLYCYSTVIQTISKSALCYHCTLQSILNQNTLLNTIPPILMH